MAKIEIPTKLVEGVAATEPGRRWLKALPEVIAVLADRWHLTLSDPFAAELTSAWVAPCESRYGSAVLKLAFPHFEADYELDGLLAWNGGCTVRVLASDASRRALLLERCQPGTFLRAKPMAVQDSVIAGLASELWQTPPPVHIRSLAEMVEAWCVGAERRYAAGATVDTDLALARRGIATLRQLAQAPVAPKLLATDLHAGNVLASSRRPWLVIDPKPHVGDASYDLTQHLMNAKPRLRADAAEPVAHLAKLANVSPERLLRWTFGRLCLEVADLPLARRLADVL